MVLALEKLAHCDIKATNIGIDGNKMVLLDADELVKFGKNRRAATKGENISEADMIKFENRTLICDENTDVVGFNSVMTFIDKVLSDATLSGSSKITESYLKFLG